MIKNTHNIHPYKARQMIYDFAFYHANIDTIGPVKNKNNVKKFFEQNGTSIDEVACTLSSDFFAPIPFIENFLGTEIIHTGNVSIIENDTNSVIGEQKSAGRLGFSHEIKIENLYRTLQRINDIGVIGELDNLANNSISAIDGYLKFKADAYNRSHPEATPLSDTSKNPVSLKSKLIKWTYILRSKSFSPNNKALIDNYFSNVKTHRDDISFHTKNVLSIWDDRQIIDALNDMSHLTGELLTELYTFFGERVPSKVLRLKHYPDFIHTNAV